VAAYNAATARVADREGAVLVDLNAAGLAARAAGTAGTQVAPDGLRPSTAGHAAVAAAFAAALEASGGP
jgi:lysophospholipase L1-like esterase